MVPLVSTEILRLFEKLRLPPLYHISKHLNACAIVVAAEYFKKWEKILRKKKNKTSVWEIRVLENQFTFWIVFPDTAQNFSLCSKEELVGNLGEPFSKEMQLRSFNTLKMLSQFFPPTSYDRIIVSLGPRCPDFPFRFLSLVPRGTAQYVTLEGELEVNGANLVKFLERVQVKDHDCWSPNNRLVIQVKMKNFLTSDKIRFENSHLNIRDARFLTRESTPRLGALLAEIGVNNFTSQDLNAFLKMWMVEERQSVASRSLYIIDIREDQNIKLEEVMEGLNPYVGNRKIRDRWHIHSMKKGDLLNPIVTDMNGGLDISNSGRQLGTVLLEPTRFIFVTWMPSFTWEIYENEMRTIIRKHGDDISRERRTLEMLQKRNGRQEYRARENQSRMRECREKIRKGKTYLARSCEIYHKLITEWNND